MVKKKTLSNTKNSKIITSCTSKRYFSWGSQTPRPIFRNFTVNLLSLMSYIISPFTKLGNQNGVNSFEGEDGQK